MSAMGETSATGATGGWVDISSASRLRADVRAARRELRAAVALARANEDILAALHEIALALIARGAGDGRRRVAAILRRRLRIDFCEWIRFDSGVSAAVRRAAPGGVRPVIAPRPPRAFARPELAAARSFCALSLFRGPGSRVRRGVLILATRRENAFSNVARADLLRRLAEMIAAAEGDFSANAI